MNSRLPLAVFLTLLLLPGPGSSAGSTPSAGPTRSAGSAPDAAAHAKPNTAHVPAGEISFGLGAPAFIENLGQWPAAARFIWRGPGMTARLETDGFSLLLRADAPRGGQQALRPADSTVVALVFEGASPEAAIEGWEPRAARYGFFSGGDPSRWRSRVPGYGRVAYRGLYECIDLVFRPSDGDHGILEYDLILAPGADLSRVVARCEGALGLALEPDGALVIATPLGELRQPPPETWQEDAAGKRRPVACRYRLIDQARFGFDVEPGDLDPGLALVIDPLIVWASFLGGSADDSAWSIAVAADGSVIVAGTTSSPDFPIRGGACPPHDGGQSGGQDAFVARLDPFNGELLGATFLGGAENEEALAVAIASTPAQGKAPGETPAGELIYLAGYTASSDFPVTNGTAYQGGLDGFAAVLDLGLCELHFATYLGGVQEDIANSVAASPESGELVVAGFTGSFDFPTTPGAFQEDYQGGAYDAFVCRIEPFAGSELEEQLAYSSFLGGSADDALCCGDRVFLDHLYTGGLAVEEDGTVVLAGRTNSWDFPTTDGAYRRQLAGFDDVYVTRLRLDPGLDPEEQLLYSTLYGGDRNDSADAVAVAPGGRIWITGFTFSTNLPTTPSAHQRALAGSADVFLACLDPSLEGDAQLAYATYHGGSSFEAPGGGIAVGPSGQVIVGGETQSADFPVTPGALDETYNGDVADGFIIMIDGERGALVHATFLGGSLADATNAVALGAGGELFAAGFTYSAALEGAPPGQPRGRKEALVLHIADSRPGCPAPPVTAARALWEPRILAEGSEAALFEPAGEYTVAITLSDLRAAGECAAAGAVRLVETLPRGWTAEAVSHGGLWDAAAGAITWELDLAGASGAPDSLSYTAIAGPAGAARFSGSLREPASVFTFAVEGESTAASREALAPVSDFGSIQHWLILGPFTREVPGPAPGEDEIRRDYLSDCSLTETSIRPRAGDTIEPRYGDCAASTGLAPNSRGRNPGGVPAWVEWRDFDDALDLIDLAHQVYGPAEDVMCYALCYLRVESDITVHFGVGSDDSVQVLLDGIEIHNHSVARPNVFRLYQDLVSDVELEAGEHVLLVKVFQGRGGYNFRLGFLDAGGVPIPGGPEGIVVSLEPEESPAPAAHFRRGDAGSDGTLAISDAILVLSYLFLGGPAPGCLDAADVDDSGDLTITDPVYLLSFLFLGGSAPPAPYPACGPDPTPDLLDCAQSHPCGGP
jgi:hypothetical protein